MTGTQPRQARSGRRFDSLEQEAFLNLWRTYDRLRTLEDELFLSATSSPEGTFPAKRSIYDKVLEG